MTFSVPVSELSDWDLERVLDSIRRALQLALTERPTTEEAPEMAILLPPQRRFLLHCQEAAFRRDVERYRRWATGRTFRSIALEEQYEVKGKTFELDPGAPIGFEIPGDELVRESVARIYEAIWLESFLGRRRRIDTSAMGISKYSCPEHSESDDCEKTSCQYLKEWWKRVELTLPSDRSGF